VGRGVVALTVEHVPQVRVAHGAAHLHPRHAHAGVLQQHDVVGITGLVERRPPTVRAELGVAAEQFGPAALAAVHALGGGLVVLTGEGPLGAVLSHHLVRQRIQSGSPLGVGPGDRADPVGGGDLFGRGLAHDNSLYFAHDNSLHNVSVRPTAHPVQRTLGAMATKKVDLEVGGRTVGVSSPDRVVYEATVRAPEITKLQVCEYVAAVGEVMMHSIGDRPTAMERWPGGWHEGMRLPTGP